MNNQKHVGDRLALCPRALGIVGGGAILSSLNVVPIRARKDESFQSTSSHERRREESHLLAVVASCDGRSDAS